MSADPIDVTPDEAWLCVLVAMRKVEIQAERVGVADEAVADAIDALWAERDVLDIAIDLVKVSAAHYERVRLQPSIPDAASSLAMEREAKDRGDNPHPPVPQKYVQIGRIT